MESSSASVLILPPSYNVATGLVLPPPYAHVPSVKRRGALGAILIALYMAPPPLVSELTGDVTFVVV